MEPLRTVTRIFNHCASRSLTQHGVIRLRVASQLFSSASKQHRQQSRHGGGCCFQRQGTRDYATKTVHDKATRRISFAPKIAYTSATSSTWIISDDSVSSDKEATALAQGLGLPWSIKRVRWRQGLQWLPMPFKKLIMDYHHVINRKQSDRLPWFLEGDALSAPFPSFVIGSGAQAVPGLLHVSRMSGRASFSVHIHFPALPFIHFDQVFLQRHEVVVQLAGLGLMKDQKNYFRTNSTLNTISPKSLELSRSKALERHLIPKSYFTSKMQNSNSSKTYRPVIAVLIGGPNEECSHNTDRMVNRLARLLDVHDCRLLVTFSQRTADNTRLAIKGLMQRIQDEDRIFVYDPMANSQRSTQAEASITWDRVVGPTTTLGFIENRNPYEAILALADSIVVTADSVAMTNEALAAGKPVYIIGGELARGKLKVFHRYLADRHTTRAFRPGRVPVMPSKTNGLSSTTDYGNADPLSYPGDHPAWNREYLAGQGPEEAERLATRLKIIRDCRLEGRRVPEHIANATC